MDTSVNQLSSGRPIMNMTSPEMDPSGTIVSVSESVALKPVNCSKAVQG